MKKTFNQTVCVLSSIVFILCFYKSALPQAPRYIFQLGVGLAIPLDETRGAFSSFNGIDTSFLNSNYGGGIGFNFTGSLKFSLDKGGYTRAVLLGSYNTFINRSSGFINQNGYMFPIHNTWNLNYANLSAGLEFVPVPSGKFTPFFNANFLFNVMSGTMTSQSSIYNGETNWIPSLRMGFNGNAGFEIKVNKTFGIVVGGIYSVNNLLFKDNDNTVAANYGNKDIGFNDKGGPFFSNFYGNFNLYNGNEKRLNSLSIYAGISLYFYPPKKSPDKKKPAGTGSYLRN